ncbi:MAG: response regulator [Thiotrichaceae bacterium]|nr:response regulator [Thiotrichaceae bacterium]
MKFGISTKITLLAVMLVLLTASSVGVMVYKENNALLVEKELNDIVSGIDREAILIKSEFEMLKKDVSFLSKTPPIQGIFRTLQGPDPLDGSSNEEWLDRLSSIFSNFLLERPEYTQIRFISVTDDGLELVRVEKRGSKIITLRKSELQNKGEERYYTKRMGKHPGDIYFSNITLNKEHGAITKPYSPVILAVVPVFDNNHVMFGLVVINMDLSSIFKGFMNNAPDFSNHYVTNDNGDYLAHHDSSKVFGFEFDNEHKVQTEFPGVAGNFGTSNISWGVEKGVVSIRDTHSILRFIPVRYDQNEISSIIYLGVSTSLENAYKNVEIVRDKSILLGMSLIIVGVVLAILFSRMITRPLTQIISATKRYGRGDYSAPLPTDCGGEIGTLSTVIKTMGEEVDKRNKEIINSEKIMKSIVSNAVDGIVTIDENCQVLTFNAACEKIFGFRREEIIGSNISILMSEGGAGNKLDLEEYFSDASKKILGQKFNVNGERKNRDKFPLNISVSEMDLDSDRNFVVMMRDVTEENKAKEELLQYRDHLEELIEEQVVDLNIAKDLAENANIAKSEFLANMSHELRTPLNSLLILAENLVDNKDGNLTSSQLEAATIIHHSGKDLLVLINDILDLAKIESGKYIVNNERFFIASLIEEIKAQFTPIASGKGLYFKISIDDNVPKELVSDRQRISQILKNFSSNAFKFTHQGGVELSVKISLSSSAVLFSVKDSGIGIPDDKLQSVFMSFVQVDGTTSREYGGTGLGLSISTEMAKLIGGEIALESDGSGSVFSLSVPCDVNVAAPIMTEQSTLPPNDIKSISNDIVSLKNEALFKDDRSIIVEDDDVVLIIEDDPHFARILYASTHLKGFKCLISNNGIDGIALALDYKPDAIILDIGLPDISGLEVFEKLHYKKETRDIPVYFISVHDEQKDLLEKGAVGYLTKPITQEQLDGVIDDIKTMSSAKVKDILIVEDDIPMQHYLTLLFYHKGINVVAVDNAEDALEALKTRRFCGMMLDLMLPGMSGLDLLDIVSDDVNIIQPPVMIYSGKDVTDEERERLQKYTDTFIKKQDGPDQLLKDVLDTFSGENYILDMDTSGNFSEFEKDDVSHMEVGKVMNNLFKGMTALLVDDDKRNTFALSFILNQAGFETILAEDGQQALDALDKNPDVDIVLMDIMMPVMDGYEAIERIRQQSRFESLPVLAVTAKAMKEDRDKCLKIGATDYLPKPIEARRLFTIMESCLNLEEEKISV